MSTAPGAPPTVVITVIRYLGRLAILLVAGMVVLTWRVLDQAGKAGQVDPVAVGAVAAVGTLAASVIGALGALLVSVRGGDGPEPAPPPTPVEVVNEDPVEVEVT